jgi:hypothetical protein
LAYGICFPGVENYYPGQNIHQDTPSILAGEKEDEERVTHRCESRAARGICVWLVQAHEYIHRSRQTQSR